MILTKDGKLSRYLSGQMYNPTSVRMGLYESSDGEVGSIAEGASASKAGLINFTRSIALEFATRGLRANCIAPAGIQSPFVRNFIPRPDFDASVVAYYSPPIPHRLSKPEDVARAIAFLASAEDAPMITGAVLLADWGTLA